MRAAAFGVLASLFVASTAQAQFTYHPPGDLPDGSGQGRVDEMVYAPGMRFPMEEGPAYANSQVYNPGGYLGPAGGQCDAFNYSYPWRDNYCEIRQWDMPLCPAGTGHQGQDIRAATCDQNVHWIVAGADGTITNVGSYSVYVTAADGTRYDYLHMGNVQVSVGEDVKRGDRIGMVSNEFGGTPTTIHLHFNIRQFVEGLGSVYVPPYMSLVSSYQTLFDTPPQGALESVGCDRIVGWAVDFDAVEDPATVTLLFGQNGAAQSGAAIADAYRGDLCENIGFCDHGLDQPPPLSLFDGSDYDVAATAPTEGGDVELTGGPLTMTCDTVELTGRRRFVDPEAWGLSDFWDAPPVSEAEVAAVDEGKAMPDAPTLWRDADGDLFVNDEANAVMRPLSVDAARAWRFDLQDADDDPDLSSIATGANWPARPVMVSDDEGSYVMDVRRPELQGFGGGDPVQIDDGAADSKGCGCHAVGHNEAPTPWWLLVGALALWRQRRRRPRRLRLGRTKPSAV
jgi:MYXO-CTERM domain-containing protein